MPGSRPRAFVGHPPIASGMRAQRKRVGSAVQFDRRATQSRGLLRAPGCLGEVLGTRAREPWHAPTGLVGCCSKVPKQSVRLRPVSAASQRARILTAWLHLLAGLKDGLRVHRAWAAYPSQALGAAFEINGAHLLQLTCLLSCCLPACAFCTEPSMHTPLCRTQGRLMFVSRRRAAHLSQIKWSLVLAAAYSRAQPCTFGSRLCACVSGPKRSLHGGGGGTHGEWDQDYGVGFAALPLWCIPL